MNKESYENVKLEIIRFTTEDVITTSTDPHQYEGEEP